MIKQRQLDNDLKLERTFEQQTLKEIEKEKLTRAADRVRKQLLTDVFTYKYVFICF